MSLAGHPRISDEEVKGLFESALVLSRQSNLRVEEAQARIGIAKLEKSNDAASAFEHLHQAFEIERSLYSEESARRLQAVGLHRETSELQEKLVHERKVREETARLLSEVEKQKARAEEADRAKTAILGLAAHDLSNQLGALVLGIGSLKKETERHGELSPWNEEVEDLESSASELRALLRRLLDYSAIQSGTLSSNPGKTDMVKLVDRVAAEWRTQSAIKRQSIMLTLPIEERVSVFAALSRVAQVLHTLISNGVKYAPEETPIEVWVETTGKNVRIEIRDHGPGINKDEREYLFQAFRPLSNRPTGGESSTGLGLHIAKAVIENEGGLIDFAPRPDRGSIFSIELATDSP